MIRRGSARARVCALSVLAALGCDDGNARGVGEVVRYELPFVAKERSIQVFDGQRFRPMFMKGINLGVGVPGSQPGQLAISRDQYRRWFEQMHEAGFNVLRIYTLHQPRFYEELRAFNLAHLERPLYLMQGIWLDEENPSGDIYDMTAEYDEEIENVINASYGEGHEVAHRYGKAFGTFVADVTPWVISWVVGREVMPWEVRLSNERHSEESGFAGRHVRVSPSTPFESWIAARIDKVVAHEYERFDVRRPVAFSSWPTLDPLVHPIEGLGSDEDKESVDMANIDLFDAPGGFIMIFHAYPYYPDFVVEDPKYSETEDFFGPNSYAGYLADLTAHYGDVPVVIGEFGTSSSWAAAHYAASGMHHGGLDDAWVGFFAGRMLQNIKDSGCAGGAYFAWMDEWWKRTWITDELDFPRDRRFRWHNVTAAEQNFGLITFDLGEPRFDKYPAITADGAVESLEVDVDASFFHVRLTLRDARHEGRPIVIGFDTYRDDLGESELPNGVRTDQRSEFAVHIDAPNTAMVHVTQAYDTYGIWHFTSADTQLYHSIPSDGAPWMPLRWKSNGTHTNPSGEYRFPETSDEVGRLRIRDKGDPASNLDAIIVDGRIVHLRLPWTFLHFNDPSQMSVLDDDRATVGRETATSEGVRIAVSVDGSLVQTERYVWPLWNEAPPAVERVKASLATFSEKLHEIE